MKCYGCNDDLADNAFYPRYVPYGKGLSTVLVVCCSRACQTVKTSKYPLPWNIKETFSEE